MIDKTNISPNPWLREKKKIDSWLSEIEEKNKQEIRYWPYAYIRAVGYKDKKELDEENYVGKSQNTFVSLKT